MKTTSTFLLLLLTACICVGADSSIKTIQTRQAYLQGKISIDQGLTHGDPEIRRKAVYDLFQRDGAKSIPRLEKMASDPDAGVGEVLVLCAKSLKDAQLRAHFFDVLQKRTPNAQIRMMIDAATFDFHRVNQRLSERKDWDFAIQKLSSTGIPSLGMKFAKDPEGNGHRQKFFAVDFDDSKWGELHVGSWSDQGYQGYNGIGWYRIRFQAPPKPDCNAAELVFGGVDEAAWIWLNGIYVGSRDEGPEAWNRPFTMDVTQEIQWGKENILVVRDRGNNGGIIKPIFLEILK